MITEVEEKLILDTAKNAAPDNNCLDASWVHRSCRYWYTSF